MQDYIIDFSNVKKIYEQSDALALNDVNFSVSSGEFFCIVGPSGCGKSTILKIIAGLDKESSGKIVKPTDVSMVFQSGALFPWLTVYENVAFGLKAKEGWEKHIKEESLKYI